MRTDLDHAAEHSRRSDPRESQRSDLAESLKMRRVAASVSALHPGLADATVVREPYMSFFTRRNKSSIGYLYVNNQ